MMITIKIDGTLVPAQARVGSVTPEVAVAIGIATVVLSSTIT